MDLTVFTPELLLQIGALADIVVLIGVWYVYRREQAKKPHHRFGVSHAQAIMEMGERTRAEAERQQRDMHRGAMVHGAR